MLSVLLKILAVIGIAVLIILGIALFLILIVLFVPITYKIRGQIADSQKEASVKVNWLFGIIRFTLNYTGELKYTLKVLWFDLTGLLNGSGKKDAASTKEDPLTKASDSTNGSESTKASEAIINSGTSTNSETSKAPETIINSASSNNAAPNSDTTSSESSAQTAADTGTDKDADASKDAESENEASPKESISDKANNLIFKIQSICDKIKGIWKNISYYINLLKEDDTKGLIAHCLKVILNILKSIRPRKLTLDAIIGFDSPDTTGKVYGYLCMLYLYYGDAIHITPDFEKQIISGKVFCSGRIFICILVLNALRILFDRKLFKVIHKLKNGGKRNGR